MVRPNITNAITFKNRQCFVCGNSDWKDVEHVQVKDSITGLAYTTFVCNHCGVLVDITEPTRETDFAA
jgi:hypothetical protein